MSEKLKAFAKTQRGKLVLSLSALGVVWLFLLIRFVGNIGSFIPSSSQLDKNLTEIEALQQKNIELKLQEKSIKDLEDRYDQNLATYWNVKEDGNVEIQLRNLVEEAATKATLQFNSLGSVRRSNIKNELFAAEIDFSSTGTLETISLFLAEIEAIKPKLSWKRLDLSLDRRRQPQSRNATVSTTTTELNMSFNGSIRVICIDNITEGDETK